MAEPADQNFNSTAHRPTWAEIDLDALAANYQVVRQYVGDAVKVMPVVKANAYGHGAVRCAQRLAREAADWFGVATIEEGIELRQAGIKQPILCLSGFWEGQEAACIQHRLTPVVYRLDMIAALDNAARGAGATADIHLKIDTGMGRLGIRFDSIRELIEQLSTFENVRIDGLMTHLAAADDQSCEPLTRNQVERFNSAAGIFRDFGFSPTHLHLANSAGVFDHTEAHGNMVRPGGVLYGLWRDVLDPTRSHNVQFQPVMSVRSRIILMKWVPAGETLGYGCTFEASRPTLVATLPIGYHDGYMRGLSNRGRVIVRGEFASVIGRISMDLTIIDVTNIRDVAVGDVVTLLGSDGAHSVTAEDLAKIAGTISYELTCGISDRVRREYDK